MNGPQLHDETSVAQTQRHENNIRKSISSTPQVQARHGCASVTAAWGIMPACLRGCGWLPETISKLRSAVDAAFAMLQECSLTLHPSTVR